MRWGVRGTVLPPRGCRPQGHSIVSARQRARPTHSQKEERDERRHWKGTAEQVFRCVLLYQSSSTIPPPSCRAHSGTVVYDIQARVTDMRRGAYKRKGERETHCGGCDAACPLRFSRNSSHSSSPASHMARGDTLDCLLRSTASLDLSCREKATQSRSGVCHLCCL